MRSLRSNTLPTVAAALLATLALGAVLWAVCAPAARANASQESIFQDDALLLWSGPQTRDRTLDTLQSLGVDTLRVLAIWQRFAPDADSTKRPAGFDATDPAEYPGAGWAALDGLIVQARKHGMNVILNPTAPAPLWASRCKKGMRPVNQRVCKPSPTEFGRFVTALGKRYSGHYGGLPRVTRWSVWNEPNVSSWLQPQNLRRGRTTVTYAAYLYRQLYAAATTALRRTGHGSNQVLIGEVAPIGHTRSNATSASASFLRSIFCLNPKLRPLKGRAATLLRCRGRFDTLRATGIAIHPYGRGGSQSPRARARKDEITIGNLGSVRPLVRAARKYHRISRVTPIYLTEHGYQTNPPDTFLGVKLRTQASWINESDWIAYKDSWVRSVAQYLLNDDKDVPTGFQTGLRYFNGAIKPSFAAYRFPIWVTRAGKHRVRIWGQLRAVRRGTRASVRIQFRARGQRQYKTVATRRISRARFINTKLRARPGYWRLQYTPRGGSTVTSRVMAPARR